MMNWKAGIRTLWLEVRASNAAAIALYESLGFNEATIRRNYYPTADGHEDAIIMHCQSACKTRCNDDEVGLDFL